MSGFLLRFTLNALGLWLAARLLPGVAIQGAESLALAALLLGVVNAVIRPVLFFLTLPITVLTLGLFVLVLNAAMLGLVAAFLPGFSLAGFLPALGTWLVVSVTSWLASAFVKPGVPEPRG